jgi:mRNA interferase MazF
MSSERIEPQRGDIVIIADRSGELTGKPRPAVVVQSPYFVTATLTVCPITSIEVDAPLLRIALSANEQTGLSVPSWAAVDQLTTIRRTRGARRIGRLDNAKMFEISQAVLVFLGIADAAGSSSSPASRAPGSSIVSSLPKTVHPGVTEDINKDLAMAGIKYVQRLPDTVPTGCVLVHNSVRPTRRLDLNGFRAWLQSRSDRLELCPCSWATELGEHYRVRRDG